jgi:hypothetical protein
MSAVRFETLYRPAERLGVCAKLEDVRLAAALLAGAASVAEEELAGSAKPALAAAGPLRKIIQSCNDLERAIVGGAGV